MATRVDFIGKPAHDPKGGAIAAAAQRTMDDDLRPVRGMLNAFLLSLVLWTAIVVGILFV
jgi:hypothetical protein